MDSVDVSLGRQGLALGCMSCVNIYLGSSLPVALPLNLSSSSHFKITCFLSFPLTVLQKPKFGIPPPLARGEGEPVGVVVRSPDPPPTSHSITQHLTRLAPACHPPPFLYVTLSHLGHG